MYAPAHMIEPPLPVTKSILPIMLGNTWQYTYNVYDPAGNALYSRASLSLSIPVVFGVEADTQLIRITPQNADSTYDNYLYGYAWDDSPAGLLIAYRHSDVAARGVYILGTYDRQGPQLLDSAQLWFAYPAAQGYAYRYNPDPTGDTSQVRHMEILSVDEPYYFPDQAFDNASSLRFISCYVYKETFRDTISYYYNDGGEKYGTVAYQRFHNGTLLKTYILQSFTNDWLQSLSSQSE